LNIDFKEVNNMASRAGKSTVNMFLPLSHMKNQEKIAEKNAAEAYSSNGGQKRTKSHELAGLRERRSKISNKPEVVSVIQLLLTEANLNRLLMKLKSSLRLTRSRSVKSRRSKKL